MLELNGVGFRYPGGERDALQDIDLQLAPGECLGLLGSNGAGKTTLLSLVSGLLQPSRGVLHWRGERRLGLVPQQLAFYGRLSVEENLQLFADLYQLRGAERQARLTRCLRSTALEALRTTRAARLSGGQQRRLNFALGLLRPATLYLFDEATVGVDAHSRQLLLEAIDRLVGEGCAVIYTSHYLEEVERVAQRILLLADGRVQMNLDTRALLDDRQGHDLLIEWPGAAPAELAALLGQLGLAYDVLPGGYRVAQLDDAALQALCRFVAAQPTPPSLFRFGRPSLEQLYLKLTGGEL